MLKLNFVPNFKCAQFNKTGAPGSAPLMDQNDNYNIHMTVVPQTET